MHVKITLHKPKEASHCKQFKVTGSVLCFEFLAMPSFYELYLGVETTWNNVLFFLLMV